MKGIILPVGLELARITMYWCWYQDSVIIDNTGVVFSMAAGHASQNMKYVAKRGSQNDGLRGDTLQ